MAILETLRRLQGRKKNNSGIRLCKQARIRVVFFQGSNSKSIPQTLDLLRQFVEPFWARDRSLPIKGNKHYKADIFTPCVRFEPHEPTNLVLRQLKTLRAVTFIDGKNSDRPFYKSHLLAAVSAHIPSPSSTLTQCSWRTMTSLHWT